jgi:hypothetical protein
MPSFYTVRPCRTAVGFISMPTRVTPLDLGKCKTLLEAAGYAVRDITVMLSVQGEVEMTLYKTGKVLANTDDREAADRAVAALYEAIGLGDGP